MNWILLLDTSVIIYSIGVFAGVILLLTVTLLFAKTKLTPAGDVSIVINGDESNPVTTSPGSTLLSTLSQQNIFLPSACGGGGTCAMCKCQVIEG